MHAQPARHSAGARWQVACVVSTQREKTEPLHRTERACGALVLPWNGKQVSKRKKKEPGTPVPGSLASICRVPTN
jgi:hypothetical protein